MASETGQTNPALIPERLIQDAHRFSFFQVVHLLQRQFPDAPSVGQEGPAIRERIRFRPAASLAHPATDVVQIKPLPHPTGEGPDRVHITTTFLGLYGVSSPLPVFYTEQILWDDREPSPVREFLDLFHHRFLSFFYRCWAKYRYHIQYRPGGEDPLSRRLFALMGLEAVWEREAPSFAPVRLLRYLGLFTRFSRPAVGLEALLRDFFEIPSVTVLPCVGRWISLPPEEQTRLGRQRCLLGQEAWLGSRILGRRQTLRIQLGSLSLAQYQDFFPGTSGFQALLDLVRLYLREPLDVEVVLQLADRIETRLRLDSTAPPRLGWTTWLGSRDGTPPVPLEFKLPVQVARHQVSRDRFQAEEAISGSPSHPGTVNRGDVSWSTWI